jgi:hypothetical protein
MEGARSTGSGSVEVRPLRVCNPFSGCEAQTDLLFAANDLILSYRSSPIVPAAKPLVPNAI